MPTLGHADHLRSSARGLIYVLIFLFPLVALSFTPEPLELNKQTVLLLFTFAAAIIWLASQFMDKRARFRLGWMNLAPLLFLAAFILPALSSVSPYLSWVGAHRQEYTSVLTALGCAILIWVMANTIISRRSHQILHAVFVFSTSLTALLALLSFLGVPVFSAIGLTLTFNTVGTLTSFTIFLVVMNAFFLCAFLSHRPHDSLLNDGWLGATERVLILALSAVTFFFLLALDYWPLWLLFTLSIFIPFVFIFFRAKDFLSQKRLLFPLVLFLAALPFWFFLRGPSFTQMPIEVTPSFDASLGVASRVLQESSSRVGTGSGTYAIDYAQFHDGSINQTDFWDTRFDRANSHALTLLPTLGALGTTLLALFVLFVFLRSIIQTLRPQARAQWLESFVHLCPWLTLVLSAFLFPWDMTQTGVFAIFSGLLISQTLPGESTRSFDRSPGVALLCSLAFGLVSFVFLVGVFLTTQRYMAEVAFARAVEIDRHGGELQQMVELLDRAASLNRYHDTYYRALGEALLMRVNEELASVSSVDMLTPESSQYVQALIASVVNAHTRATELSSHNVDNWLARGKAYRELIPVMGQAAQFAVQSHARAVELDPMNPRVATELGRTLFASAQGVRPLTVAADPVASSTAKAQFAQFLADSERAFARAIELKANYAPAHFELALVYEVQGRMQEAVNKMETVAAYNPLDVGVQFQLGMLYLRRAQEGDTQRASAALERAIELSPQYSNAHWFLASIYESQGDMSAAVQEVEAVLAANPDNELVKARLERLLRGEVETKLPDPFEGE